MREGNLRGGGSKGRVIVVVVWAIFSRLAVNQSSHGGAVRSFAVSQSVSQSANRQPNQPSRSSLGSCRPTEHGNTITTPGTLCLAAPPLRPASARPRRRLL